MSTQLLIEDGERKESVAFPPRSTLTVGRGAGCDVRIEDPVASRGHCQIELREDGTARLTDLGSQNGTFVNGARVVGTELVPGDVVRIGRARLTYRPEAATAVPARPAPERSPDEVVRELSQERAFLLRLVRAARDLTVEHELMPLLQRILDAVLELTHAERAFVMLQSSEDALECEASRNFHGGEVHDPDVAVSRSIAQEAMRTGRPLFSINAREDDRFKAVQSIVNLGLRSVLCAPIRFRDETLGVIYIDNRLESAVFSERDRDRLVAFADHVAVAVANARLIRDLTESNQALSTARARLEFLNRDLRRTVSDRDAELASVRARLAGDDPQDAESRYGAAGIVGRSPAMRRVFDVLDRVIESDFPVQIEGESGTGKELVARAIHRLGPRRSEAFVSENCAALPETLLESELFGSLKGAFTGANANRRGLVERAHRGTLFLDEVSEMSPGLQAKLLRFLQEGEFRPVGGTEPVRVDVRILSASNKNLRQLVADGRFREDLYYRLAVLPVRLPPLRERPEDLPALVERFVARAVAATGRPPPTVAREVLEAFARYDWPGNVRELENEVRRLVTLCDDAITAERLSPHVAAGDKPERAAEAEADEAALTTRVAAMEVREIQRALREAGGNKSRAAAVLGISRFALNRKLEKYGIDPRA